MDADDPYIRASLRQPMPEPDTKKYSRQEINEAIQEEMNYIDYKQRSEPPEPTNRDLPPWIASRAHLTRPRRYF